MESGGAQEGIRQTTAEEEALKRNTDCVYFLASPLTCKKGGECEYRHSEGARINPRDCWYWLNGNCLNPKCSFRHPPLDGLIGVPATSGTSPFPQFQAPVSAQLPAPHFPAYSMSKQSVPCYYFQKGHCLKGDRCPFMHGPPEAGNAQDGTKVSSSSNDLPLTQKKDLSSIKECILQHIASQPGAPIIAVDKPKITVDKPDACFDRPCEAPLASAKSFTKPEGASSNMQSVKKSLPTYVPDDDCPVFNQNHLPGVSGLVQHGNPSYQAHASDDRPHNSRDADEFLGESSPGFDVLVDNDDEDSGYLHEEDEFGRASVQAGRDLYLVEDYEYIHGDYELVTKKHERDRYGGMIESDRLGQAHDSYEHRRSRTSSERILDRSSLPERTHLPKEASMSEIDRLDLRHRLLKQRRLNGSRSAVSPDDCGERHRRDERYMEGHGSRHARRDQRQVPRGSTISTRLQGRIKLPGRSSGKMDMHTDKERDSGRPRGRLSPGRSVDFQMRDQERARRRSNDIVAGAKSHSSKIAKRDDEEPMKFAGPKSLAELKSMKATEGTKLSEKATKLQDFEGPKPLSVILKRKRGEESSNGPLSGSGKDGAERSPEAVVTGSVFPAGNGNGSPEEHKFGTRAEEKEEGLIPDKGVLYADIDMDAKEGQDLEHYDAIDGESDYETVEYGEYKTEDENAYHEDNDEFDDDDDFARKVGVVYS